MSSYADLRKDYNLAGLSERDLLKDPFRQFEKWFQEAEGAKIPEPNAMVLSTCNREAWCAMWPVPATFLQWSQRPEMIY